MVKNFNKHAWNNLLFQTMSQTLFEKTLLPVPLVQFSNPFFTGTLSVKQSSKSDIFLFKVSISLFAKTIDCNRPATSKSIPLFKCSSIRLLFLRVWSTCASPDRRSLSFSFSKSMIYRVMKQSITISTLYVLLKIRYLLQELYDGVFKLEILSENCFQ